MTTLTIIDRAGVEHDLAGEPGLSVMELIRKAGFDELLALCGGCCSCATCHVYVEAGPADDLPEMGDDEDSLLDGSDHRRANSRLSCQIEFSEGLNGLKLSIAPED